MESWVRQGEAWREGIDRGIEDIVIRQRSVERAAKEMTQNSSELASKVELEAMKDRVQLLCNQGVASAISVWHDKVDLQLRGKLLLIYICNFRVLTHVLLIFICKLHWNHCTGVERQMANLRVGGHLPADPSEQQVLEALATPFPSEVNPF